MEIKRSDLDCLGSISAQHEKHKAVFKDFAGHLKALIGREEGLGIASTKEIESGLELLYLDRPMLISYSFLLSEEELYGDGILLASVPFRSKDENTEELDRLYYDQNGNVMNSREGRQGRFNITHKQDVSKVLYRFLLAFLRSSWFHNRQLMGQVDKD